MVNNCVICTGFCSLKGNLSVQELELINKNKHSLNYREGEIVFKQGSPITHVISFKKGLGKAYIEGLDGKDLILSIIKPNALLSGPGAFIDNKHYFTMRVLTDSVACFLDINVFKNIVRTNPAFAEFYIQYISQRSIDVYNKLITLSQKHITGRIAEVILYLANYIFEKDEFDMIISRKEFAEFTSTTKESVCRILSDFKRDGFIHLEGNNLKINDFKALEMLSQKG